ncbi:MAG: hypothetical protein IK142_00610 [Clostridiales bacterium]|nr:hypothetical protein [Clostridiales bacterium]
MTKSDQLYIDSTEEKASAAIAVVDEFLSLQNLDRKKAIHLRLLAEEAVGMVKAMTGDFEALFWMEQEDGEYKVKLTVKTDMDREKKEELLSLSTSGDNTAAKGIMGKIREIIENSLLDLDSALRQQSQYGGNNGYTYVGMGMLEDAPVWSLNSYREALEDKSAKDDTDDEAWDELERSIVASLAKDVTIGIKNNLVDMTITAR